MTAVVIAFRDLGCPHRRASFEVVHKWYVARGFEVVVEAGDRTFTRASGINTAIRRTDAPIIVQSDPDSLVPLDHLRTAIDLASEPGVVIPHNRYLYLSQEATEEALTGRDLATFGPDDCDEHGYNGSGNVVVFSRETWELAGGFDERFGMWGGDDGAFAYAAEAFTQPSRRLEGDMWHLWHPRHPHSNPNSRAYRQQFAIVAQYRDAVALGAEAVRELVRNR